MGYSRLKRTIYATTFNSSMDSKRSLVHTQQNLHFIVFYCDLVPVKFTHISQGYFTGTGAMVLVKQPKTIWAMKHMDLILTIMCPKQHTGKQNKTVHTPWAILNIFDIFVKWIVCLFQYSKPQLRDIKRLWWHSRQHLNWRHWNSSHLTWQIWTSLM